MEKWPKPNGSIDIQWCSHINQVQEEPDLFQIGTGLVDAFDSVCMIHLLHWMLTESEVSCKLNRSFTPTPAALLLFGVSHHLKRDLTQGPQQGSSGWSLGSSGSKDWHFNTSFDTSYGSAAAPGKGTFYFEVVFLFCCASPRPSLVEESFEEEEEVEHCHHSDGTEWYERVFELRWPNTRKEPLSF